MIRWKCICSYDGGFFEGWQTQVHGNSVQDVIVGALEKVLKKETLIQGSGRTDSGVHANGQVFHFDADWSNGGDKLIKALHTYLPQSISIKEISETTDDFHARYSATGKIYRYELVEGRPSPFDVQYKWGVRFQNLDVEKMKEASRYLLGEHDFSSFAVRSRHKEKENPVKTIHSIQIDRNGKQITLRFEGSGFLYKMVRSLVGGLVDVGKGKITPSDIQTILEQKERTKDIVTAPPEGLYLEKVFY